MTTMSEIVLVVCLVREQLLQNMVEHPVRFRKGCQLSSLSVAIVRSALGRWLGKDRASLLAEQKLQCVFLSVAVANPHQAGDAYINFANTTDL